MWDWKEACSDPNGGWFDPSLPPSWSLEDPARLKGENRDYPEGDGKGRKPKLRFGDRAPYHVQSPERCTWYLHGTCHSEAPGHAQVAATNARLALHKCWSHSHTLLVAYTCVGFPGLGSSPVGLVPMSTSPTGSHIPALHCPAALTHLTVGTLSPLEKSNSGDMELGGTFWNP